MNNSKQKHRELLWCWEHKCAKSELICLSLSLLLLSGSHCFLSHHQAEVDMPSEVQIPFLWWAHMWSAPFLCLLRAAQRTRVIYVFQMSDSSVESYCYLFLLTLPLLVQAFLFLPFLLCYGYVSYSRCQCNKLHIMKIYIGWVLVHLSNITTANGGKSHHLSAF